MPIRVTITLLCRRAADARVPESARMSLDSTYRPVVGGKPRLLLLQPVTRDTAVMKRAHRSSGGRHNTSSRLTASHEHGGRGRVPPSASITWEPLAAAAGQSLHDG